MGVHSNQAILITSDAHSLRCGHVGIISVNLFACVHYCGALRNFHLFHLQQLLLHNAL